MTFVLDFAITALLLPPRREPGLSLDRPRQERLSVGAGPPGPCMEATSGDWARLAPGPVIRRRPKTSMHEYTHNARARQRVWAWRWVWTPSRRLETQRWRGLLAF